MRWLLGLVLLVVAQPAFAKSSNPAFLGVQMQDLGGGPGTGPCMITGVTKDSAAETAGLHERDVFVALDGTSIASCDHLVATIQGKVPGDSVKIVVTRESRQVTVDAILMSRDEVLRKRFGGLPVPSVKLASLDGRQIDLSTLDDQTTIVGWYPTTCNGCGPVFTKVASWAREQRKRSAVRVYAASAGDTRMQRSIKDNLEHLKPYGKLLDVPLLVADARDYGEFTIGDGDRIQFMVIDCRGIVQYAAPLIPGADDEQAVLDELFAAAEQAARRK